MSHGRFSNFKYILIIDFFGSKIYFSTKFAVGVFWWRLRLKFMKKITFINSTVSDCSWHTPRTKKNSIKINKSQNPQIGKFYAKKNEEYLINFLVSENRKLHCGWVKITFHSRKKLCANPFFNNNFFDRCNIKWNLCNLDFVFSPNWQI